MKFSTPLTLLAVISSAYALVIEQPTPLKQVITDVNSRTTKLNDAAKAFKGDIKPVLESGENLIKAIKDGQAVADGVGPIDLDQAAPLLQPLKDLDNQAKELFGTFQGRIGDIKKAKACDIVREKLGIVSTTGNTLIDSIIGKVTSDFAKAQAKPYTDDIKKLLAAAEKLFSKTNCVNA